MPVVRHTTAILLLMLAACVLPHGKGTGSPLRAADPPPRRGFPDVRPLLAPISATDVADWHTVVDHMKRRTPTPHPRQDAPCRSRRWAAIALSRTA